ncbi:MAG: mannitol dehydrogenase family protein [Lachnospiraceae bacterium]|nr:mannitol dehydrogenase family protein [Lachnospiraceae bacterium]
MELNVKSIVAEAEQWKDAGVELPAYDIAALKEHTKEAPEWVHFGPGNIFRDFIGGIADKLIAKGKMKSGISAVAGYDAEIIEKIYEPCDNLTLSVGLKWDGTKELRVFASIAEAVDPGTDPDKLKKLAEAESLKLISFTITEKGYVVADEAGKPTGPVAADIEAGPDGAATTMAQAVAMLYYRFKAGAAPVTLVSLDNCSNNGDRLKASVLYLAEKWQEKGFVDSAFMAYVRDGKKVAFPLSMIDRITPRPDAKIAEELEAMGIKNMSPIVTKKQTWIAPFVNAELPRYLVIEDNFPNGRPPLEEAGVYMTDRESVMGTERMKVGCCLNPLHTALAVCGCLLGYKKISDEMNDEELKKLVYALGDEGMAVTEDPGIIHPADFVREVLKERLPNPFLPDTPQRIACDTSQKVPIRFGGTINGYAALGRTAELKYIPFVIAAWLRYLAGVDDELNPMELSPDPRLDVLCKALEAYRPGELSADADLAALDAILADEEYFASDLTKYPELSEKIRSDYRRLMQGKGALRSALKELLKED